MVNIKKFITEHLLIIFILFALIGNAFVYLKFAVHNLSYPYAILAGLEDENLARSLMVLQGRSLYSPLTDYPFVVTLYPPVFYYLAAVFLKIFGVTFFAGRLLSLICSLLVSFLCFKIAYLLTKKFLWGLVAGLLFLLSGFVQWWGLMFKNDIMAVFFGLAAIYLFLRYEKTNKFFLSTPFILLAVFTKQTFLTLPAAIIAYLFFSKKRDKRRLIRFSFSTGSLILLALLLLIALTKGQFFIDTIIVPRVIPWDFSIYKAFWETMFQFHGFLLIMAFGYLLLERILYRENSLVSWYFIFSALARVDMGISGSSENYFMETLALAGILTTLFLHRIFSSLPRISVKNKYLPDFSISALLILVILALSRQSPAIPATLYGLMVLGLTLYLSVKVIYGRLGRIINTEKLDFNNILGIIIGSMFIIGVWQKSAGLKQINFLSILLLVIFINTIYRYTNLKSLMALTSGFIVLQLVLLAILISKPAPSMVAAFKSTPPPPSNLYSHQKKIDDMIKDNPGRVLVDSESFLAIKNNRDFEYIPVGLKLRQQAGYWDFEKSLLYDDIGQQKFRFFIKSQGWTDPEIMYKIFEHYELTRIIDAGAFLYEIYEPSEGKYAESISTMRQELDEAELKDATVNQVFVEKIDQEKYLLGLTFAYDVIYATAIKEIVNHPQFEALYRPLHSRHPNSSAVFRASNLQEVEKIIATIFAGLEYTVFSTETENK